MNCSKLRVLRALRQGFLWGLASALVLAAAPLEAATILQYSFNETGNTAASTGTNTTAVTMRNDAGTATDLHGPAGSGVTGITADRAFANLSPNTHGSAASAATNGFRADQADLNAIDQLQSFTLSGWFKTETAEALAGKTPRLFWNHNDSSAGFNLQFFSGSEDLKLDVDDNSTFVNTAGNQYADKQAWVFFAVTYDGTVTSNNIKFYKGYRTDAEAKLGTTQTTAQTKLISTHTLNRGTVGTETIGLVLGNRTAGDRPFDGYLDEMRIDGGSGASNALTLAQIEAIRVTAVNLPEPSSFVLASVAGALVVGYRWRKRADRR